MTVLTKIKKKACAFGTMWHYRFSKIRLCTTTDHVLANICVGTAFT